MGLNNSFANIRKEHVPETNDWKVFGDIVSEFYDPQNPDPAYILGTFNNPDAEGVPQGTSLFQFFTTQPLDKQSGWVDMFLQHMADAILNPVSPQEG